MNLRGIKLRRFTQNQITYTKKRPKITVKLRIVIKHTFRRKHPRISVLPTQLQILIKISRIGFPGNQFKIFIS